MAEDRVVRRLARPYALTGGRTVPSDADLAVEALVELTWQGYDGRRDLAFEKREILDLTRETISVAEVAAHLEVPLGVARVLVSDLADVGFVKIHPPAAVGEDGHADPALLKRVLHGLKAL